MMDPHPLREMISDHSCKNCRYPERGCTRYLRLDTCQEFQPNDDAIFREIVRLKIAHLWRVVEVIHFKYRAGTCKRHQTNRIDRLQSACLAKIAELKEMQCSTKS